MPERMNRRTRRLAPLAAFAILAAGYFALWFFSVNKLKSGVADWVEDQRAAGLSADYGAIRGRGFPALVRADIRDVEMAGGAQWRWTAPQLNVDFSFLAPSRLTFSARAPHEIRIDGVGAFTIDAPDGSAAISGDDQSWRLSVAAKNARIRSAEGGETLRVGDLDLNVQQSSADADRILLSLDAAQIDLTRGAETIEASVASADIWAVGANTLASGLGGAIDMRHVQIELAGARIKISGVLRIAPNGAISGKLQTDAANPGAVALAAGQLGLIPQGDAEAAAGALTVAALAGGGRIVGPLTIEGDGVAFAGVRLSARQPRLPVAQP